MEYHNPVLLKECIEGLNINPAGIYVDVTFGGGGHSREILKHLTTGKLYAFDQDDDAVKNKIDDERFVLIKQNFRYLKNFLKMYNALPIDGLLADLGVSSHQFDEAERGFSIRFNAKLDMRMDQNGKQTAADVLNTYSEEELKRIFKLYGEVDNAGYLASIIFHNRKDKLSVPLRGGDKIDRYPFERDTMLFLAILETKQVVLQDVVVLLGLVLSAPHL